MIVTDPNQTDNPIVFSNDAFQKLTGYGRNELIGKNCRFLQGPDTDPESIATIREAIAAGDDVAIDLLNYRTAMSEIPSATHAKSRPMLGR